MKSTRKEPRMRVQRIEVGNLFGVFLHDITLHLDDRITIVYGPNGYGKTYTLRLVDSLVNGRLGEVFDIPFGSLALTFDTGGGIRLVKSVLEGPGDLACTVTDPGGQTRSLTLAGLLEAVSGIGVRFVDTQRLVLLSDSEPDRLRISMYADAIRSCLGREDCRPKLDLLLEIVNGRFTQKSMSLDAVEGFVFATSPGRRLRPDQLSSGEQHLVVLLYELLFTIPDDTLILLDEPELSLHVYWQQQFIADLQRIIGLVPLDILIATHSPQIIHDRWDLAVELTGPES